MVLPGNKRLNESKNINTDGGNMKTGLVPLVGKNPTLFRLPRHCCSKDGIIKLEDDLEEITIRELDGNADFFDEQPLEGESNCEYC